MIESLWTTNEKSADYSFNKSHAACYALISYRTAWLKANYPAEYMAALISSVMDTKDKVPFFVNQTESMGIEILPPDVNESDHEFVVVEGNIRFGLDAVKGVGYAAVEAIKRAREEGGPFTSLWDFCERVDCRTVNKRAIEALIKCGAFGSTGATRRGMLEVLDSAQARRPEGPAGRGDRPGLDLRPRRLRRRRRRRGRQRRSPRPRTRRSRRTSSSGPSCWRWRRSRSASSSPSTRSSASARRCGVKADCALAEIPERKDGEWVKVGGIITEAKKIRTRSGTTMMFATVDDLEGTVEVVVFEKAMAAAEGVLAPDEIVLVRGRVDHKDANKVCIVVQDVERFDPSEAEIEKAKATVAERGRARGAEAAAPARRRRAPARRRSSPTCASCSSATPARTTSCSRCTPAPACAACASAATTRSPPATARCKSELRTPARRGARRPTGAAADGDRAGAARARARRRLTADPRIRVRGRPPAAARRPACPARPRAGSRRAS